MIRHLLAGDDIFVLSRMPAGGTSTHLFLVGHENLLCLSCLLSETKCTAELAVHNRSFLDARLHSWGGRKERLPAGRGYLSPGNHAQGQLDRCNIGWTPVQFLDTGDCFPICWL